MFQVFICIYKNIFIFAKDYTNSPTLATAVFYIAKRYIFYKTQILNNLINNKTPTIMIHSNSQDTKLNIIEQLIILNDDSVFSQIEELISKAMHRPAYKKLSKREIENRAMQANKDIENKEVFSQSDVEKQSQNW